ncbi:MAG: GNAT family N-acetyltransferase [Intestinibacter bartlettii]|uniref:GNAT family N-acetyltransferase n=1 Tax=Intestinibacter bartlettii TaxID=261299 RepID=UPI0026EABD66|nr:GNAT family N-acetyltransferase [Intestinibacter bartlettii]MDO5011804.1 GNAT family N-acetyltransferase [Intestinibacter bartlettii]
MKIIEVKERTITLINQLLEVWEDSVKATHLFLSNEEIKNIKEYVPQALKEVSHLVVIESEDNVPIAFMGIEGTKLEMLFIKNSERGKGLGKQLLNYGIENYSINEVTVNEQNPNAKGFYEYIGFKMYKKTELDEQGKPYPILHMRLDR